MADKIPTDETPEPETASTTKTPGYNQDTGEFIR